MAGISTIELRELRVEREVEPLGIDVVPRFSWELRSSLRNVRQTSYRLRVLRGNQRAWDSGEVLSAECVDVEYAGKVLNSATRYSVQLDVTTTDGHVRTASHFTTGLLADADWAGAEWISGAEPDRPAAPLIRTEFDVAEGLVSALFVLAVGGFARVQINGSTVDEVLTGGITDFDERVQYQMWDITGRIREGGNAIGFELGRAFYAMTSANTWGWETAPWHAEPTIRAVLLLDFSDGRREVLASGPSWKTSTGPTLYNDLFGGETFDARNDQPGFSAVDFRPQPSCRWQNSKTVRGPGGRLVRRRQPPIRIVENLPSTVVSSPERGTFVLDFGRVIAGWVRLRALGDAGATIRVAYGEKLSSAGRPNNADDNGYFAGRFQTDEFILAGTGAIEEWEPGFGWKGFQYVEVSGWPNGKVPNPHDVLARVVHSDVASSGAFACSNDLLNRIHSITVTTLVNNLYGLPTDTPMYEKNGWTGDGFVGTEMLLLNFDAHELLAKWVDDIADTRHGSGAPEVIAPHGGWTYDWTPAPTWHAAYVLIPWWLYLYSGDRRVLADHYVGMSDYVLFELERSPGGIANTTLGDWVSPETDASGGNPPEDRRVSATVFLYAMVDAMHRIALVLGHENDAVSFAGKADEVRSAFLTEFYSGAAGFVSGEGDVGFRQAHNVLALAFGLIPDSDAQSVADAIAADVVARGYHLNTGALATKYLLPILTSFGHGHVAFAVAVQRTFPSWGFWLDHGATTLWEHWSEESRSRGHYFLGTVDDWFYSHVAGIRVESTGFLRATVRPGLTYELEWARAHVRTSYGDLAVSWRRFEDSFQLSVTVPVGTEADVYVPGGATRIVFESGAALMVDGNRDESITSEGVLHVMVDGADAVVRVASGNYDFHVRDIYPPAHTPPRHRRSSSR
ncbi:MAG: family 78 glycoside hydrolase catalytic domain [Lacisediminihabitans sp.]